MKASWRMLALVLLVSAACGTPSRPRSATAMGPGTEPSAAGLPSAPSQRAASAQEADHSQPSTGASARASEPTAPATEPMRLPDPSYDSDGDGVPDTRDGCPEAAGVDAPSSLGAGCPERSAPKVLPPAEIEFDTRFHFDSGRSSLRPGSSAALDEIARVLAHHQEIELEITGHSDSTEPEELALMRARRVRDALSARGVSPPRLTASGQGSKDPAATNATAEGRAQNRRVELLRKGPRSPLRH